MYKICNRGCGLEIEWRGKTGEYGSTGYFETDSGIEHTFTRCNELIAENKEDNEMMDTVGESNL